MAYGRKGDLAQADLASAQAAFTRGDIKTAQQLAARAKTRLPVGSPAWVRADDIVSVKAAGRSETMTISKDQPNDLEPAPSRRRVCRVAGSLPRRKLARAQSFSPAQRGEIERIVHDYLIAHPEVLQEAMAELEKRQTAAEAEKHKAAVKEHARDAVLLAATRSRSAIRTATSPSSSSSITTAATASAPWTTC